MFVTFPEPVWSNYHKLVSEKELVLLGHLQIQNGKKGLKLAMEKMGYSNLSPISAMVGRLKERGLIVENEKGEIDIMPFFNACQYELEAVEVTTKPKEKKDNTNYRIAGYLWKEGCTYGYRNVHGLAKTIQRLLDRDPEFTEEKIVEIAPLLNELKGKYISKTINTENLFSILLDMSKYLAPVEIVDYCGYAYQMANQYSKEGYRNFPSIYKINDNVGNWIKIGKPKEPKNKKSTKKDFSKILT